MSTARLPRRPWCCKKPPTDPAKRVEYHIARARRCVISEGWNNIFVAIWHNGWVLPGGGRNETGKVLNAAWSRGRVPPRMRQRVVRQLECILAHDLPMLQQLVTDALAALEVTAPEQERWLRRELDGLGGGQS